MQGADALELRVLPKELDNARSALGAEEMLGYCSEACAGSRVSQLVPRGTTDALNPYFPPKTTWAEIVRGGGKGPFPLTCPHRCKLNYAQCQQSEAVSWFLQLSRELICMGSLWWVGWYYVSVW